MLVVDDEWVLAELWLVALIVSWVRGRCPAAVWPSSRTQRMENSLIEAAASDILAGFISG